MNMIRLVCAIFFGFWLGASVAQTPSYIHYDVRDGLPGNLVYCGVQDRRGLLWFGTDKGLACFDGTRFRTYGLEDGLPDLEVLKIKEDRKGRLWLFCFRKEPCYVYNGRIYNKQQDSLLARIDLSSNISNIIEDDDGGLWFMEYSFRLHHLYNNKVTVYDLPEWAIGLRKTGPDHYIVGMNSVMRLDASGKIAIIYKGKDKVGRTSMSMSGNRILYSYNNKLVLLELKDGQVALVEEKPSSFGSVFTDHRGRFWLCSSARGAVCFDNHRQELTNPVTFLADKKVTTMFEDTQGTYWFCTTDEGIFALPQNAPIHYGNKDFPSNNIRFVSGNPAGYIFAGDDIGNIHIIDGPKKHSVSLGATDGGNLVRQIIPVGNHAFWAVSDENISYCSKHFRELTRYTTNHSFKSIFCQNDRIWYAASGELGYLATKEREFKAVIEKRFTTVEGDSEGNIWAGDMSGFYSRRDSFQKNLGDDFPELKSRIMAIQNAGDHRLWVATPESGLLLLTVRSGEVITVETINNRLNKPIRNIQSLYAEPSGRVWMATNRGVYGLDNNNNAILHFDRHDGLADDDVNAVFVRNDTLWVATVSGLTMLVLRSPNEQERLMTVVSAAQYNKGDLLVRLQLLDSILSAREIVLPPDATSLELDLTGLDYRSRGNLRYEIDQSVQLLPFRYWTFSNIVSTVSDFFTHRSNITQTSSSTYSLGTYLPPGRYRIQVTAIQASGTRSRLPDIWVFLKIPHWYETLWFYLLLWAIALYVIWRMYRVREAYKEISAASSALQLQALQAQMNPHFIGNSINAIQQFMHPPDPIKASEYVSLFTRLLRRTMLFSEKTFIPFEEELAYDREYLQLIRLRFGERVQVELSGVEQIPPDTPVPSMLLQPVLENATIHGLVPQGVTVIRLDFLISGDQFRCTLSDNGIGFKETQRIKQAGGIQRTSKGLEMLRKKITTLNRLFALDISLDVTDLSECMPPGQGTQITITYHIGKIWKALKNQAHQNRASE